MCDSTRWGARRFRGNKGESAAAMLPLPQRVDWLEGEACSELNLAVAVHLCAFNLSKVRAVHVVVRVCELRRVEQIERVAVQFQRVVFRQMKVFLDAQVHNPVSGSVNLVAAEGAE